MNRVDVWAGPARCTTNAAQVPDKPRRLRGRAEVASGEYEGLHAVLHKSGKLVLPVPNASVLGEHDPTASASGLEPLAVRHTLNDVTEHLDLRVDDHAERAKRRGDNCRPEATIDVDLKLLV